MFLNIEICVGFLFVCFSKVLEKYYLEKISNGWFFNTTVSFCSDEIDNKLKIASFKTLSRT